MHRTYDSSQGAYCLLTYPSYPDGMAITMRQIKAGRALLGWRQVDLAKRSGVALLTIQNIETNAVDPRTSTMNKILQAFTRGGLIFLEAGDIQPGGEGVRLKKPRPLK
jgi:transcriptional regulator with XRE-family HTH domain